MKLKLQGVTSVVILIATMVCSANADQKKKSKENRNSPAASSGVQANDPDYVIGIEDVLAINVWHEPELTRSVSVRPDGKISLPLVGEVEANGLTPKDLQVKLAKQLESMIKNPEITVMIQEIHSQKFNILGEVGRPGSFPLVKHMTVLDAVATAGGLKDFAKAKKMYILRRSKDGNTTRIAVNYNNLIKGTSSDRNFEIEPRDTIVVP
jgi:polysaccharide export outer membrane protein